MLYFLLFIILLLLSAFFSGIEIAYFSLNPAKTRLMLDKKEKNSIIVWKLKQNPQKLLITILIGNNIVNILAASVATSLSIKLIGSVGIGLATGVVTLFILIFGEITPKTLAHKYNENIAKYSAPAVSILQHILSPISWLLIALNSLIIKMFKVEEDKIITEEEIRSMARLGVEIGVIEYREREMIENVFHFNDKKVKQVLIPRYKVICLNGDVPIEQIAHFVSQSGYSRYPVYEDDEDNIIGYIHVNDLMKYLNSDQREELVKNIVRKVRKINENSKIEPLFRSMLKNKDHLAIVLNNEQEFIGIITLEDILEEIVGEIQDETDK